MGHSRKQGQSVLLCAALAALISISIPAYASNKNHDPNQGSDTGSTESTQSGGTTTTGSGSTNTTTSTVSTPSGQCNISSTSGYACASDGTGAVTRSSVCQGSVACVAARSDKGTAALPFEVNSICRYIDNTSSGTSIFVPFRRDIEWQNFVDNVQSGNPFISLTKCIRHDTISVPSDSQNTDFYEAPASAATDVTCDGAAQYEQVSLPYVPFGPSTVVKSGQSNALPRGNSITIPAISFTCTVPGYSCYTSGAKNGICGTNQTWTETAVATFSASTTTPSPDGAMTPTGWSLTSVTYGGGPKPVVSSPVPTVTLTASNGTNSSSPISSGTTVTLTWTVKNATSCTASNGWNGSVSATGGTQNVSPTTTTTYTLVCTNSSGSSNPQSVTVNVSNPGACGGDNGQGFTTALGSTDAGLCSSGTIQNFTAITGGWSWSCGSGSSSSGSGTVSCSATHLISCLYPGSVNSITGALNTSPSRGVCSNACTYMTAAQAGYPSSAGNTTYCNCTTSYSSISAGSAVNCIAQGGIYNNGGCLKPSTSGAVTDYCYP